MTSETVTIETRSAGGVVQNERGQILVVSQKGTSWSLPKGHIDEGEDALTAARREIYEEAGIQAVEFVKDLGTYKRYKIGKDGEDDMSELKFISMFLFRTKENDLKPIDPHNPEARWVDQDEVSQLLSHPKDKEFFRAVLEEI